jgi:murein DD-endopeptidase MepM/ murein hydrolase activator NlpD
MILWLYRDEVLRYVPELGVTASPHERYGAEIRARGLDETALGRAWIESSAAVIDKAAPTPPLFSATGTFSDSEHPAAAWRFRARRGQRIGVDVEFSSGDIFIDVFRVDGDNAVASAAPASRRLTYDVERDADFILRVQPALLRGGPFVVTQTAKASFEFPVQHVSARAVGGIYGDPRCGGRRTHEGIDIFAARETPAVAAEDGWITGATTNRLGGNVVWLWAPSRRVALYYAHLHRQAVSRGQRVKRGDVVGYVGTTGNARGTPPHLHFGIYAAGEGSVDPLPYVCDPPCGERLMHPLGNTTARN